MRHFVIYIICCIAFGCASPKSATTSSGGTETYSEDLSLHRPKVEKPVAENKPQQTNEKTQTKYVEPKHTINKKVDTILDSIDSYYLSRKFVEGFTIQVYSGKREEALNTKKQLNTILPDLTCDVQFTEPIFRVKAGKYFNRIDAQKDFIEVKKYFPAAIVIPDKIVIN